MPHDFTGSLLFPLWEASGWTSAVWPSDPELPVSEVGIMRGPCPAWLLVCAHLIFMRSGCGSSGSLAQEWQERGLRTGIYSRAGLIEMEMMV